MHDAPEITPVRDVHRFDEKALEEYLLAHLPGFEGGLVVSQFEGGQSNPTYLLRAEEQRFVMRKKPPGTLLKSAHQVEREYRVMTALRDTDVPVPNTHLLCEDESVIGTPFYVMEHVQGRVTADGTLPHFDRAGRAALYDDFVRVLASLHRIDPESVGLGEFGRPGNYYARQISRWSKQYRASETQNIAEMEALMEWLPENIPESDESGIVHGDYRIGNCVIHPEEPRIVAVLDWELSTIGHPLADLAYCCQSYHGGMTPGDAFQGLDLAAAGIPDEDAFVARYCELVGRERIEDWDFYMVFVMFRSAAIVQGVYKRGLDGNASSQRAGDYGSLVVNRAREAWSLVQRA